MSFSFFSKKELRLLFVLATIQFSHIVDFMIMMPLGPQLMRLFQINPQHFGWLVSSYTFAAGATGFFSAFWVDRFDRKKTLLFFYIGFAAGTVACALAPSYEFLLAARLISGGFGGVLSSLTFSIVGDSIAPEKRGTATGLVMTAFAFASVAGIPFSLFLANHWSWHAPFFFLGFLSFVLLLMIFKFVPTMKGHLTRPRKESFLGPIHLLFEQPRLFVALIFQMLLVFGQFSIIPFLSQSFVANAGLSEAQLPLIYLVGGVVSMTSSALIGRASDYFGTKRVFVVSALISIIPIYYITNMKASPLFEILFFTGFFFLVMGGRVVPSMALMTSAVHADHRGSFLSFVSSTQQFSSAIAAAVAGAIVTSAPNGEFLNYPAVGWLAIGFSIAAVILVQFVHPAEGKDR